MCGCQIGPSRDTTPASAMRRVGGFLKIWIAPVARSSTMRLYRDVAPAVNMATSSLTPTGGSQAHNNLAPFLCVHYIIALFGVYPSRH